MPTKFSVVIPLYNHGKYIESALNSVLCQEYPASEIILVDDGSTDNGFQIASKLLHGHHSVRLVKQNNQGAHVALNKAIELATHEYIAVLNSDDEFTLNKIERCSQIFSTNNSIDLIFGGINFIDSDGLPNTLKVSQEWIDRSHQFYKQHPYLAISLLNENFATTTSNFVFKKSLWSKIGGFAKLRYCHDYEFLMQAFKFGSVYFDKDFNHINYRIHESNTISESIKKIQLEIAAVIAAAAIENGASLYGDVVNNLTYESISTMLRNKNLNEIIIYLITVYQLFKDRNNYYEKISSLDANNYFKDN